MISYEAPLSIPALQNHHVAVPRWRKRRWVALFFLLALLCSRGAVSYCARRYSPLRISSASRDGGIIARGTSQGSQFLSVDQQRPNSVPNHVAFIIDGNGRWAVQRGLERHAGHRAGANVTVEIAKHAFSIPGINCVTLYLFSTENWTRPPVEVTNIMHLLERYLLEVSSYLIENEIRLVVIGQSHRLPQSCQALISQLSEMTRRDTEKRTLCLALSYGGRDDIVQACKSIVDIGIDSTSINEEVFASFTATGRHGIPDPELLIRTSGESRLSNFLLWQSAYSELEFVDCCWPDFTANEFDGCLDRYSLRPRRFGAAK